MSALGSNECPLRVAIIGSGPSGFYAAESLYKAKVPVQIDMFDRLPTPFGLVRGGVAPDHQKIKNVIKVYERIAGSPGFAQTEPPTFAVETSAVVLDVVVRDDEGRMVRDLDASDFEVSEDGVEQVLLFVVDILNEEATLLVPNDLVKTVASKSFGAEATGDTVVLPGVVSRKKQIIPNLKI